MIKAWQEYQEETAKFFRGLGMKADTDVKAQGVRTTHDIDVLVTTRYSGFELRWVVECKNWNAAVSKLHVLALREIVSDLGADRGILLAEAGFQSGALEAAHLTNVQLTSLAELRQPAESQVYAMRVIEIYDRVQSCRARYWAISKEDRIKYRLRPQAPLPGYSGDRVVACCDDLLKKAMRAAYPVEPDPLDRAIYGLRESFSSAHEVYDTVQHMVVELEERLNAAERSMQQSNRNTL
jgi:restriction system protein